MICLYTLRHVAIATAKRWLGPSEVAALAGHVSPAIARRSYAPKRSGWRRMQQSVIPDEASVDRAPAPPKVAFRADGR